jgi:hypothetical protein
MNTYAETRSQLLRRAAQNEDVTAEIEKLDSDYAAAQRSKELSSDIAGARTQIEREAAQKRLQEAHDDAVVVFKELHGTATDAAAHVEVLVAQAKAALLEWQRTQQEALAQWTQVHALRQQGATPVMMPAAFSGADYSIHLLRHAGQQYHQQILHTGKLPRIT